MPREPRDRSLLGNALAVGAAILAFAAVVLVDSDPTLAGSERPWQALAGVWTLNPELSGAPGGDGAGPRGAGISFDEVGGARTLRIEVDSPLVMIASEGSEVRSFYLGGPPVERQRGPVRVKELVSWSENGLVLSATVAAGSTSAETFRIGDDGNGRLLRTLEMPIRGAGGEPTRRLVYDRTGEVTRSGVRPSMLAATVVVALALVLALERAFPATDAR